VTHKASSIYNWPLQVITQVLCLKSCISLLKIMMLVTSVVCTHLKRWCSITFLSLRSKWSYHGQRSIMPQFTIFSSHFPRVSSFGYQGCRSLIFFSLLSSLVNNIRFILQSYPCKLCLAETSIFWQLVKQSK
jgi:hypothetical protein